MNFTEILTALKEGKRVHRTSWYNDDLFVFLQIPSTISKEIVPKMQSLPQPVKDEFARRFANQDDYQLDSIYYIDQLAIVNKSNIITSFTPSVSDFMGIDWVILD